MNIEKKILKYSSLEELVLKLNRDGKQVFAPVKKDNIVDFAPVSGLYEMAEDYIVTVQSAKFVVFPNVETLFEIETSKDKITLKDKDFNSIPEIILLGTRPCDAAGFNILNAMFGGDYQDTIYSARLDKTTLVSISCNKSDAKCFCTSVNGNPGATAGSDILLTRIDNNDFLAEIVTEKGKAIVSKYPELFETVPEINKDKYMADVPVEFNLNGISEKIYSRFDSDIWLEQSLRCIGCGTCAFICPTCGCFDIQDAYDGYSGQRKRSWDSCGFSLFTLHASGHNPRNVQSQRWRQRIMHKFVYLPEQQNLLGCVGCGRCSRSCSANMNLKELLIHLKNVIENE
ncbi:MAG: 4Fe-4S dicluster domain-containing protein [Bacteroidales bacterium]